MTNSMALPSRIVLGITKTPLRFIATVGTSFLAAWGALEPIVSLFGVKPERGLLYFGGLVAVALCVGIIRSARPLRREIRFANTHCHIEIAFGDIFSESGVRVIPINRFFDSELGELVSPNSLHGKLLTQKFRGDRQQFDSQIAPHLAGKPFNVVSSKKGKVNDYGIGSTVLFGTFSERYLLVATANTDPITLKANTDFDTVWSALTSLWDCARQHCGGDPIVVPLIGGGLSGLKLSHRRILDMMLLSLVYYSRSRDIGCRIIISLEPRHLGEIDLRAVAENWDR
jgi:Domain of unknown function (DUF6430)